jgi:hypothetical protein
MPIAGARRVLMASTVNIAVQFSALSLKGLSAGMRLRFRRWRRGWLREIQAFIATESEYENAKQELMKPSKILAESLIRCNVRLARHFQGEGRIRKDGLPYLENLFGNFRRNEFRRLHNHHRF